VVEGEADVPYPARRLGSLEGGQGAQLLDLRPPLAPESVEQVEIDVIGPEPLELLVEVSIPVRPLLDHPYGTLGGEVESVALARALQGGPEGLLARLPMVDVGRVEVVDPGFLGRDEHGVEGDRVDGRVIAAQDGQAHASEPEGGHLEVVDERKSSVLHSGYSISRTWLREALGDAGTARISARAPSCPPSRR